MRARWSFVSARELLLLAKQTISDAVAKQPAASDGHIMRCSGVAGKVATVDTSGEGQGARDKDRSDLYAQFKRLTNAGGKAGRTPLGTTRRNDLLWDGRERGRAPHRKRRRRIGEEKFNHESFMSATSTI